MNQYGRLALNHWKEFRPEHFARIADPEPFFRRLGEEVEERIIELADALAGKDEPGEGYMEKLGRLNMARADAESQILREMVLLPSEEDELEDEKEMAAEMVEAVFGVVLTQEYMEADARRQEERRAEEEEDRLEFLAKIEAEANNAK